MAAFQKLLGDVLIKSDGSEVKVSALEGKHVGLYFSAHWCGPCRHFTPELVKVFNSVHTEKNWEIVFVSSDRDEGSFKEYFSEMPWYALPFSDRDRKQKLSSKFKVSGIPTLVILGPDGSTICPDGRTAVMSDRSASNFPWKPKTLAQLVPATLLDNKGNTHDSAALQEYEAVGFYFSAHWCGPCRGFTPKLIETYKKLKADGKKFEIIFVSADNDENSFKKYFADMPWLAIDYSDDETKEALNAHFGVEGIPSLHLVNLKTGKTITDDGRQAVDTDPEGKDFPWTMKPLSSIGLAANSLNDQPVLVAFIDDSNTAAKEVLERVANRYVGRQNPDEESLQFIYASPSHPLTQRVRDFINFKKGNLAVFSVQGRKKRTANVSSWSDDEIAAIADDFYAGKPLPQDLKDEE